jgi:hypothetical protein
LPLLSQWLRRHCRVIEALGGYAKVLAERRHPLVGAASVTIGTIQGGTVPNMVASDCRLVLDRRILPGRTQAPPSR